MNIRPYVISFAALNAVTTFAAVPLRWTVETSRVQPAVFDAYQGETLTFEAALQSKGKPLEAPLNYSFFWQTNGMGSTYWEAPCPVPSSSLDGASTNVLFATFTPSMDVGARVYNCFIGSPSNIYHAAFQLRLRPSPGALPNALPLPTPVIDFARVRVLNPPWGSGGGGGCDTNAVEKIANRAAEESKKSKLWKADTNGYLTAEGEYFRRDVEDCFTASVPGDTETCDLVWEDARNGFYSSPFFSDNPSTYGFLTYSKDHARWELDVGGISTFTRSGTWDDSTIEMSIFTLVRHKVSKETYSKVDRFVWKNELDSKADLSMISATNTTFSNAVMAVTQDFKTNTYTKTETDALIAANKPEYEDVPSNVVWRIEAEGGRFFFKPVRPINMED